MGAGLPIVAPRADAIESVLSDAQEPLFFDQTDAMALSQALKNADVCDASIGRANKTLCQQQFTYQKHARYICDIMES